MATKATESAPVRVLASKDLNQTALPKKTQYTPISDILAEKVSTGKLVNVTGVVKDAQVPMRSRGSDFKMAVKLSGMTSSEGSCDLMTFNIFHKDEGKMPKVGALDVVYIHNAKVQSYGGSFSLISNYSTNIVLYPRAVLTSPKPCATGNMVILWNNQRGPHAVAAAAADNAMTTGAVALFKDVSEADGEDVAVVVQNFDMSVARTATVRDKRSTLENVKLGNYYDLVVRVVAEPIGHSDRAMIWASDYTVNDSFLEMGKTGLFADFDIDRGSSEYRKSMTVGDECGYLTNYGPGNRRGDAGASANWLGPVGRRSMCISCFDEHASTIKDYAKRGSWVKLKNVHVKYGNNGRALEGFLHSDANFGDSRSAIRVDVLDTDDLDGEHIDPMLLEAMKRHEKYERTKKKYLKTQKQKQQRQQQQMLKKRKKGPGAPDGDGDGDGSGEKGNSRQRRNAEREKLRNPRGGAGDGNNAHPLEKTEAANLAVSCESSNRPVTPLGDVLQSDLYTSLAGTGNGMALPFLNIKFNAKVRVVDFLPNRLEDFATGRWVRPLERAGIQDDDASSSDDDDDDNNGVFGMGSRGDGDGSSKYTWEWRFALLLEDASGPASTPAAERPRIWAVVNNDDAEMLTGLTACDLKHDKGALEQLHCKMFLLWGNLEETKREAARRAARVAARAEAARRAKIQAARKLEDAAARKQREEAAERERQRARKEKEAKEARAAQIERQKMLAMQSSSNLKKYLPSSESDDEESVPSQPGQAAALSQPEPQPEQQPSTEPEPEPEDAPATSLELSNLPFVCCIKQFGIEVRVKADDKNNYAEDDDDSMLDDDADENLVRREWQQAFSMYGTRIKG